MPFALFNFIFRCVCCCVHDIIGVTTITVVVVGGGGGGVINLVGSPGPSDVRAVLLVHRDH